ncbi:MULTISPECIES: NAD-dependent epimerase/dehydratase family protein [unclassified Nocardioides]|uniref:NAD-dependent epimerase/dehydratase family protein n=1 Tax=unclassified Nocardioides TaxID=2615069 RepID=UPI0006FF5670|nr:MULTISPECIES: NAD-dependent epimerase/dehydratase family protein [unclassified Nocardioides]KRA37650.1 oxidoreductase [Nocardioides sp. Root614]KRA91610.1 oxidoreductase [Nocardioides sp. Root682]
MTVFITGGRGFIARALADRLRGQGIATSGVDLVADPSYDVVAGSTASGDGWQAHVAGAEVVVHTAALVTNTATHDEAWQVNVLGTRRALDAAIAGGARRFVHVSSVRAFGDLGWPDQVTEDHPVRNDGGSYVDSKIASEQVVLQAHAAGEIEVVIVRPGDVYGPGSRPWTVQPVSLIRRGAFVLPALGRGVFSPVYVDDLVAGLQLAVSRPAAAGQVFTIGGGVGVTCAEFFGHYFRMLGKRGPLSLPTPVAVGLGRVASGGARVVGRRTEASAETMHYFTRTGTYSIAKAQRLLGYSPEVDLDEGMRRTEAWLRESALI